MPMTNMMRRLDKLEVEVPNQASMRVLFKQAGQSDPMIEPPLGRNEQVMLVVFGRTSWNGYLKS